MCLKKKKTGRYIHVHTYEWFSTVCSHQWTNWCPCVYIHYCPPKCAFCHFFPPRYFYTERVYTQPRAKLLIHAITPRFCSHEITLHSVFGEGGREGGGGGIPPGDNLWSLSVFDYIVLIHWQNDKLKGVMSSSMSGTALRFLKRSHDIMWVEATYPVSHHSSKVKRWDQIHISIVFHNKPCSVTTQIPISFYIQSNVNSVS